MYSLKALLYSTKLYDGLQMEKIQVTAKELKLDLDYVIKREQGCKDSVGGINSS